MAQYKTGTVTLSHQVTTVVGVGTSWTTEISAGQWFSLQGADHFIYQVLSITDDTHLELSVPYVSANLGVLATQSYWVFRDFTSPDGIPILSEGDVDTHRVISRMSNLVQGLFNQTTLSGITELKDLTDIDPALNPAEGQILSYDFGNSRFQSINPVGELKDLSDINPALSPGVGDSLVYAGGGWIQGSPSLTLDELTNVQDPLIPSLGDALVWDGAQWVQGNPKMWLGFMEDVESNLNPTEGSVLRYHSFLARWTDDFVRMVDIFDMDDNLSPNDGDILVYDNANSEWIAAVPAAGGGAISLSDLTDVDNALTPVEGQVLEYGSSNKWESRDKAGFENNFLLMGA